MRLTGTALRATVTAAVAAALCMVGGASRADARASAVPTTPVAGVLLYISADGVVDVTTVNASGATSPPEPVGPLTAPTGTQKVTVNDLVASGDGRWAAWSELITSDTPTADDGGLLVARDNDNGLTYRMRSTAEPVGFVGHRLIASNGVNAFKLLLTPSPHLVSLHEKQRVLSTYKRGLVDDVVTFPKKQNTSRYYEHVRLKTLGGHKRVLHTYTDGGKKLRSVELSTTSGDSKHLLIERGDHTDFGGTGPSSAVDELSLTSARHLRHLGHYGSASSRWRTWTESYVGPDDHVWVTWYRVHARGVRSIVTRFTHGRWELVAKRAVTAVGNPSGYVVVQPGQFTLVANSVANQHVPTPTGSAVLVHHGHEHALAIQGSAFVWISKDDVPKGS